MKKGQFQVGFNWIFILIAGAVILLFFVGIVVKQKQSSDDSLARSVVGTMDSILTAAQVAEKTTNVIPLGGLADFPLAFDCAEGVSSFSLEGKSFRTENGVDPLFAPAIVQGDKLILMSLPYLLPYKTTDFLMVGSPQTQYIVIGKLNDPFVEEFLNQTDELRVKLSADIGLGGLDISKGDKIRLVDMEGVISSNLPVPSVLQGLDDSVVSAVSFSLGNVWFYTKKGNNWQGESVPLISMEDKRDAAKYGAIFSEDADRYWCGMQKAFKRINLLDNVYLSKGKEIKAFYLTKTKLCQTNVVDLISLLTSHKALAQQCKKDGCTSFMETVKQLQTLNTLLRTDGCEVQLY